MEDESQLDKFLVNINDLPLLKAIVVYKGACKEQTVGKGCKVMSWESFMAIGNKVKDNAAIEDRMANTKPGK